MSSMEQGIAYEAVHKYSDAEQLYRTLSENQPRDWNILFRLGVVQLHQQKHREASQSFFSAIQLKPDSAEIWSNLGVALLSCGRVEEGTGALKRAVELDPNRVDYLRNYGIALKNGGVHDPAIEVFESSLRIEPNHSGTYFHLAQLYRTKDRFDQAEWAYERAMISAPNIPALTELSELRLRRGKLDQAIEGFAFVLTHWPDLDRALLGLGNAYYRSGKILEAKTCFERTIHFHPENKEAWHNLGALYCSLRNRSGDEHPYDQAEQCILKALSLDPNFATAHHTLGNVYKNQGQIEKAIQSYRRAVKLDPTWPGALSSLCYASYFSPNFDAASILKLHQEWNLRFASPIRPHTTFSNARDRNRRLKVGYVSPDFREHVLSLYMCPLFAHHDHTAFEVYMYSAVTHPDEMTERIQGYSDHWREIHGTPPIAIANQIRSDEIDLLIDLSMHMSGSQLQVFAHKPAPVQITWMAYPGTTGLRSIDYRLTDPYLDPPGLFDDNYSEESIRLPHSFWCIDPLNESVNVRALPADRNGFITFGNLNNPCKINEDVIRLWCQILRGVPNSRLLLLSYQGQHRTRLTNEFLRYGVSRDRIQFMIAARRDEYLKYYHQIDITIDSFPYNGHTTSIDSLWMGVPVITLIGETVVGRAGLSQLSNVGHLEFVASDFEDYVNKSIQLASDREQLRRLRASLRGEIEKSVLMDKVNYTRDVEQIYRQLWIRWCDQ